MKNTLRNFSLKGSVKEACYQEKTAQQQVEREQDRIPIILENGKKREPTFFSHCGTRDDLGNENTKERKPKSNPINGSS